MQNLDVLWQASMLPSLSYGMETEEHAYMTFI